MESDCVKKTKPPKPTTRGAARALLSKLPHIKTKIIIQSHRKAKATASKKPRRIPQKGNQTKSSGKQDKRCFWPCLQCPQIFSTEERLAEHILKCGNSMDYLKPKKKPLPKTPSPVEPYYFDRFKNVYVCSKCRTEYNVKSAMEDHLKTEHPGFLCNACDKTFTLIVDLGYHSAEHTDSNEMKCPCCDFKTEVKCKLAFHIQTVHSNSVDLINVQDVSFTCVVCAKAFYNRRKLWHHQKNYHKATVDILPSMGARLDGPVSRVASNQPKVYLCDTCGKNFNSKYRLERHQRAMHQGLKPYICRFCGRAFTGKDTMQKHERIHTGEKPYSCEYCGKCFRQPGPFSVHLRIHTGERPYVCKFCKKGFITNQSRKSHANNCVGKEIDYNYLNVLNY